MIRKSKYPVNQIILNRWSPRAMSGENITEEQLYTILEAGRWAQSSYNNQPWRFIYAFKDTPYWEKLFGLLVPGNQIWVKNGSVLILVISHKVFDYNNKPSVTHSFDTGAACQNMTIQAFYMGLVMHGMEGFNYDQARTELNIPEDYAIEAMFVIGQHGDVKQLPEKLQEVETPSDRRPLEQTAKEGIFDF